MERFWSGNPTPCISIALKNTDILPKYKCWLVFLVICGIAMSVMLGMVKWLEKVTSV